MDRWRRKQGGAWKISEDVGGVRKSWVCVACMQRELTFETRCSEALGRVAHPSLDLRNFFLNCLKEERTCIRAHLQAEIWEPFVNLWNTVKND